MKETRWAEPPSCTRRRIGHAGAMRLRLLVLFLILTGLLAYQWFSMNGKQLAGGEFTSTVAFVVILLGIGSLVTVARK